jgi:hypothetical protein
MLELKDTKRLAVHITPCRGESEALMLSPKVKNPGIEDLALNYA